MLVFMMNEHYPTLREMAPWHKKYPITWIDGWNVFRWPALWSVLPEAYVVLHSNEPKVSLHSIVDSIIKPRTENVSVSDLKLSLSSQKKVFVFIFDGIHHGDTTLESKGFADDLEKDFSDFVQCFVVTRYYESQTYDPIDNVLWDIDFSLEKIFGATGQCIYIFNQEKKLIRKSCGFLKEILYLYLKSLWK